MAETNERTAGSASWASNSEDEALGSMLINMAEDQSSSATSYSNSLANSPAGTNPGSMPDGAQR